MADETTRMAQQLKSKLGRSRLTLDRFVIGLLVGEGLLLLSERFRWFPFNTHRGWTVLITVAAVGVAMFLALAWLAGSLLFRRRFQFGLRSLLLLLVAVAIPCSWLAAEMKRANKLRFRSTGCIQCTVGHFGSSICSVCSAPAAEVHQQRQRYVALSEKKGPCYPSVGRGIDRGFRSYCGRGTPSYLGSLTTISLLRGCYSMAGIALGGRVGRGSVRSLVSLSRLSIAPDHGLPWQTGQAESASKRQAGASADPEDSALFEPERAGSKTAESSACLKCGQTIPVDLSRCPICGWTWEEATEE